MASFASVLSRRGTAALLAGAGAGSVAYTTRRPIALDSEAPSSTPSSSKRLSIYPEPEPEVVLEEVHTELERTIGTARTHATMAYDNSRSQVHSLVDKWIGVEAKVEHRVKSLIPKDETITPGILYVGVATMAGSILGRTRALPVRILLPPTLFLISFPYFLPKTAHNVRAYASELEDRFAPSLGASHAALNKSVADSTVELRASIKNAVASGEKAVASGLKKAEEWSGLKLNTGGKKSSD
ncbi:hypothetical protein DL93DRAFT_2095465 [Clavulina sp. PMI_390]|nr:hypothetical protein DL93DRAFT_2095465 [Clavulina sp. PMI_390]